MYTWPRGVLNNPVAGVAGDVTLVVGCSGLVLDSLGGDSLLGQFGRGAMFLAAGAAFVCVIAGFTGWGDRTEHSINIAVSQNEAVTSLRVAGDLNYLTRQVLSDTIKELVNKGNRNFVVDMDRVEDFDSTGLGTLVAALKRVRQQGGQLTIVCNDSGLREVFEITNLSQLFGMVNRSDQP